MPGSNCAIWSGLSGVDTRQLTRRIRDGGAPNGALCHAPDGRIDLAALLGQAREWPGLEGMDLAKEVSCRQSYQWDETGWRMGQGYGKLADPRFHVVAVDYGAKRNILRMLADHGCAVTVVPADATAEDILRHQPDGVFLSNGPGDPAATGRYAVPVIQRICSKPASRSSASASVISCWRWRSAGKRAKWRSAIAAPTIRCKDLATGKVEITSQNHGFCVLPEIAAGERRGDACLALRWVE